MIKITKDTRPEELIVAVRKIDDRLDLAWPPDIASDAENLATISIINHPLTFTKVYSFELNKWFDEGSRLLNQHQKNMLNDFIDRVKNVQGNSTCVNLSSDSIWDDAMNISDSINISTDNNPFKKFTDKLAETLQKKNDAYGDSFSKSLDEDGLLVLKIRLGDKLNRVSSLIKKGELKENDESLEDTLLDLAGYSILGLKYLEEHKN